MVLLVDLPPTVLNHILEYGGDSSESLTSFDLTCFALSRSTGTAWRLLASRQFGLSRDDNDSDDDKKHKVGRGKRIYQSAIALTRRQPVYIKLEKPLGCQTIHSKSVDDAFFGDFQMASSDQIIVTGSDTIKQNVGWGLSPCSLQVRDARDLSVILQLPCGDAPHRVGIIDQDVICRQLNGTAFLRDHLGGEQEIHLDVYTLDENAEAIGMIANQQFVVLTHDGILTVYYGLSPQGKFQQRFRWIVKTGKDCELMGLRWVPVFQKNAFCFSTQKGEILVYSIQIDDRNKMHVKEIKNIQTLEDNCFGSLVLSEKYAVGCLSFTNEVVVFNKRGRKMYTLMNTMLDDFDPDEGYPYPLAMELFGDHYLVTSAPEGAALCVWDLQSGELLRKFTHAFDDGHAEIRNDYPDITSMIKCDGFDFPAYMMVDYTGDHYFWGFPISSEDCALLQDIQHREGATRNIKARIKIEGIDDELNAQGLNEAIEVKGNDNEEEGATSEDDFDSGDEDSETEEFRIFNMIKLSQ